MIDSGAMGNYISTQFTHEYNVLTVKKAQSYAFTAINEVNFNNSRGKIDTETLGLPIAMEKHYKEIIFDVVELANQYIVLGIPWLRKNNPTIN